MIRLESVTKRYPNGQVAVDALSLEVGEGEVCVLVGPSGCGKTTTMKMINRLVEVTSGRIFVGGEDVRHADPVQLRRRIGYVIQQVGLFPHLTVFDNVATVPRLLGWEQGAVRSRVDELLELVGLDPWTFRGRYPAQLSGGQQQRVGVARALGADPPVLLMDEPFGAIDPITRERLQNEFLRLQAEVRKTVVFVTHDLDEAIKLGDRIAILRAGGVLEQYGPPADLLGNPASAFVADFVGADRGLKQLTVLQVGEVELDTPLAVPLHATLPEARDRMRAEGTSWAIVLGPHGRLGGYVCLSSVGGTGTVAEVLLPAEARIDVTATLKEAFAEMLLHDAGWVAVVDGERWVGALTPDSLHRAMRRSLGVAEQTVPPAQGPGEG